MSIATFVLALGAAPVTDIRDGVEVWEACAQTPDKEPVSVLVRARKSTKVAEAFATKKAQDLIIVEGELILDADGSNAILYASSVCDGHANQFLNNVTIVGRLSGKARTTESGKSASRSVAVNRYTKKDGQEKPEQLTDWFQVRGYGYSMQRLIDVPKGSLVEVNGMLTQLTSAKGDNYVEVKCRKLKVHQGSKATTNDPAAGTTASGYDHSAFTGESDHMPPDWS